MPAPGRLLVAAGAMAALALPAQANSVDLVAPNFVCDRSLEVCYDAKGPSLTQTRRTYGERAERRLLRNLSGRPPVTTFSFSDGALCDLSQRTCWDDGDRRRTISNRYTQQLFGGGGAVGSRTCQLIQRGRRVFQGSCSLARRTLSNGTAYVIDTQDGRRYNFYNEGYGRLVLRDATGVWPVRTANIGNQASFRWADVDLRVSRPAGGFWGSGEGGYGYGSLFNQGMPDPRGGAATTPAQVLDTLLNSLFR